MSAASFSFCFGFVLRRRWKRPPAAREEAPEPRVVGGRSRASGNPSGHERGAARRRGRRSTASHERRGGARERRVEAAARRSSWRGNALTAHALLLFDTHTHTHTAGGTANDAPARRINGATPARPPAQDCAAIEEAAARAIVEAQRGSSSTSTELKSPREDLAPRRLPRAPSRNARLLAGRTRRTLVAAAAFLGELTLASASEVRLTARVD